MSQRLTLKKIHLQHLRCHVDYTWECHSHLNIVSGQNGCGKTTLLEAAYILAYGRSFRQAKAPQLTCWGQTSFKLQATIQRYGPLHIRVAGKKGKVEMALQGRKVAKRKDIFDHISLIVDAPQGTRLIDGAPGERRKWLDRLAIACTPSLHVVYQSYLRALMQRGRLLRGGSQVSQLEIWEQQIVNHGLVLNQQRAEVVARLNLKLTAEAPWLDLPFQVEMVGEPFVDEPAWLEWLSSKREEHRRLGRVTQGPHCDRLKISYDGREIRICGSRGQQKLSGIALRLAECAVLAEAKRMMPILLLDDCLESLDLPRSLRLMERLKQHQGQVLMTVPGDVETKVKQLLENAAQQLIL